MSKWKTDKLFNKAFTKFVKENDEKKVKDIIITKIYNDENFRFKIDGMLYRNNINKNTKIGEDVIQEVMFQLSKYDTRLLLEAFCEDYRRVFALAITIATRAGFGKLNKDVHQNGSIAKQILFKSNLNSSYYLSNTEDEILNGELKIKLDIDYEENDLWEKIRENLSDEDIEFLDFLLNNVFNKKYTENYSYKLRKDFYSFNEYKILRLDLQNKIKNIIKKL